MMRIPKIQSIETAVNVYYANPVLGNTEIRELFGRIGTAKISELKKLARADMDALGCPVYNERCVSTDVAYRSWGLDIVDLEQRLKKIRELREA